MSEISPHTLPVPVFPPSSPILNTTPGRPLVESLRPQFAEELTPLKFRRKARHANLRDQLPAVEPQAGPSLVGFYTIEGDLFRGASQDPTLEREREREREVDEDAISLGESSTNSSASSSSAWGGRRVMERVGEALGVRRGSHSSDESGVSSLAMGGLRRRKSRSPSVVSEDKAKREHLPRKREFKLMLPDASGDGGERVIKTPALPVILDQIKALRLASGRLVQPNPSPDVPITRGGSAPGVSRPRPKVSRKVASFVSSPNPLSRPTQSRLHTLKVNPISASDLLGIPKNNSTGSLASLRTTEFAMPSRVATPTRLSNKDEEKKGCWWLDVACPGWEDLRDLGDLLGLHPLTLEDVLQQDPREKLDTFDNLGYYFVVVRALDEGYFKYTPGTASSSLTAVASASPNLSPSHMVNEKQGQGGREGEMADSGGAGGENESRRRGWGMGRAAGKGAVKSGEKVEIVEDNPGKEGLEGVGVGGVNVYLVVFADGIVSFHFEDISKHTQRVLDRILSLTATNETHTSEWIAHGILDSIVDAFFPLIRYVDGQVDDIDSLTIDPTTDPSKAKTQVQAATKAQTFLGNGGEGLTGSEKEAFELCEKGQLPRHQASQKSMTYWCAPRWSLPRLPTIPHRKIHLPRLLIYLRLFFLPTSSAVKQKYEHQAEQVFDRSTMLKRITDMRRLVTGLGRLLGGKSQVVQRLRKRTSSSKDGGEVGAYIGDLQDHILLLQTSLNHYEYILSHCQPAYLSHLSVSSSLARGGTDKAILALSTVTISILPMQLVIGLFSMNIHIPANGAAGSKLHKEADESQSPFGYFGGILVAIFLVACAMVSVIRYWRWMARQKFGKQRGADLPDAWQGYWGWS
ncbi:magnesium transporter, partial [Tremellales sp. Uapishka_1]